MTPLLSFVGAFLLYCHSATCQVLGASRSQPNGISFPKTSLCCGTSGHELISCLRNASDTAYGRSLVGIDKPVAAMYTYVTRNIQRYAAPACAVNAFYAEGNGYIFDILMQDESNSYEPFDPRFDTALLYLFLVRCSINVFVYMFQADGIR